MKGGTGHCFVLLIEQYSRECNCDYELLSEAALSSVLCFMILNTAFYGGDMR